MPKAMRAVEFKVYDNISIFLCTSFDFQGLWFSSWTWWDF